MLALVTKLLNSVSIKQGPGNENGTSSFGRKNEGYFKIMHQFYPTLENKMMRFLHEMAIHDENPHSPMRRRTMIWHIPEDMSIFRSASINAAHPQASIRTQSKLFHPKIVP